MRPHILDHYRPSLIHRVVLWATKIFLGPSMLDVTRASYYRPELFSRTFYCLMEKVMRGPSEWSVADRELFAAFVSSKNRCDFCATAHIGVASAAKSSEWVRSALDGNQQIQANPKLSVTLKFLEKLTQQPWNMTCQDIERLREHGLTDSAIEDAIMVCVVFSMGNRTADAVGVEVPSPTALKRAAPLVRWMGYRLYSI
jgi:uncharacterized peroxidase-related enzyme